MITKHTGPITIFVKGKDILVGTKVEYRIFGWLIYRKTLYTPEMKGIKEYNHFYHRI